MVLLNIFTDLLNAKSLSGAVSEPVALLIFGAGLFALTAGLRIFLTRQDKNANDLVNSLNNAVVIREN